MRKLALLFGIVSVILACGNFSTAVPTMDANLIQTAIVQTAVQANALTQNANQTTASTGKWQTKIDTSSFDYSKTVVLTLPAENTIQAWLDTPLPVLVVRCKEHQLDVYIDAKTQFEVESGTDNSTVRVRFDKDQAMILSMSHSTDGEGL